MVQILPIFYSAHGRVVNLISFNHHPDRYRAILPQRTALKTELPHHPQFIHIICRLAIEFVFQ